MRFSDRVIRAAYGLPYGDLMPLLATLDNEDWREAIEADLISKGLRLRDVGSASFSYRDLFVLIKHSDQSSALYRAQNEDHEWTATNMLLAEIADAANTANWQRGEGKARDRPKPIKRPGIDDGVEKYGGKPEPMDDIAEWLGWSLN